MNARIGNGLVMAALGGVAVFLLTLQNSFTPSDIPSRWWIAAASMVAWIGLTSYFTRPRRAAPMDANAPMLVIYATQTGFAEELARQTAEQLGASAVAIDHITPAMLAGTRSYWIASTTGEGDPPDMALPFLRSFETADLKGHAFAVLALGDRTYAHFCQFGHDLREFLIKCGAQETQPLIEVDNADALSLQAWQNSLGLSTISVHDEPFVEWQLTDRTLLNEGSLGWPTYLISLRPASGDLPQWRGGDIAQIAKWTGDASVDSADWREYSIASIPFERSLQLLVRLTQNPSGQPGLISGLLCRELAVGDSVALRIRANPAFHAPTDGRPLILIGNGTGLAGLRSLLRTRIGRAHDRNWLIFGERQREKDFYFEDELRAWHASGKLARLDVTFSRDATNSYVYHALENNVQSLRQWLADGADIFVCGSRASMATDVDRVLREILGTEAVDQLIRDGRYRRDVY